MDSFSKLWQCKQRNPLLKNFKNLIQDNKGQIKKVKVTALGAWQQPEAHPIL